MGYNIFRTIGLKFYKFEPDSKIPIILRLTGVDEVKRVYKLVTCSTFQKVTIPIDELHTKWVKLNPDGIMAFACCTIIDNTMQECPDLMVRLHTVDEKGHINNMPYAICRQAVPDIFALLQGGKDIVAGMSISQKTCPQEINFSGCCEWHKMSRYINVAIYNDDHLPDILKLFNNKPYNDRLKLIKSRMEGMRGCYTTLYDLLHHNYFMLDFHDAYGIHELDFKEFDLSNPDTNRVLTDYIITNLQEVPSKLYPIEYTKYIDLKDVKRKYILICPNSFKYPYGNITLLAYDVHPTLNIRELINKGKKPKDAKKEIMSSLGWT